MSTPDGWAPTLCPYCGVGCGLLVKVEAGRCAREGRSRASGELSATCCAKAVHLPPTLRRRPPALSRAADPPRRRAPARAVGAGAAHHRRAPARDRGRARARRGRVLRLGPAPHRGVLRRGQARQGLPRHQQLRHQLAAVHGLGGGRLHALARRRRPADGLRRPRARRLLLPDRHQHRRLPPDRVQAHRPAQARRARRRERDRGRSALDGDRGPRRSAPAAAARLGHRAAERDAPRALAGGLLDVDFIDAHTTGWEELRP